MSATDHSRWKAGAIHLAISAPVVALATLLVLRWYPDPYFEASKAAGLLKLMIGISLVVGPVLTTVVYRKGKRGMLFDLVVIAVLQITALGFGVHMGWQARPVFMVYAVDRFNLIFANQMPEHVLGTAVDERFTRLPTDGPVLAAARLPEDPAERQELTVQASLGGPDVEMLPRYWSAFESIRVQVNEDGLSVAELLRINPEAQAQIEAVLETNGIQREAVVVVPMMARFKAYVVVLRRSDGENLAIVDIDPWATVEHHDDGAPPEDGTSP